MHNEQSGSCHQPSLNQFQDVCGGKCISWSAIILGALIAVGLSFLLNLFSLAIGLSVFHMSDTGAITLAVGGLIGMLIGSIAVMFFSGWVAGFLGRNRCNKGCCGGLYGLGVWCLALILTAIIASSLGRLVVPNNNYLATPAYSSLAATTHDAAPVISTNRGNPDQAMVNTDKIGMGAFVIFALFFCGALASIIGGYCGIRCGCNGSENNDNSHLHVPPTTS